MEQEEEGETLKLRSCLRTTSTRSGNLRGKTANSRTSSWSLGNNFSQSPPQVSTQSHILTPDCVHPNLIGPKMYHEMNSYNMGSSRRKQGVCQLKSYPAKNSLCLRPATRNRINAKPRFRLVTGKGGSQNHIASRRNVPRAVAHPMVKNQHHVWSLTRFYSLETF